jgi:hypothetical protein
MKKVDLPGTNTVSIPIDLSQIPDENGIAEFGGIDADGYKELKISIGNISSIIWSAICLEKLIEDVITNYFFGRFSSHDSKRHLFQRELLQSSSMQFSFKKNLLNKICDQRNDISGKESSKLQGSLKRVMLWRNAFAHGKISYDSQKGVILSYFSGDHKTEKLNEKFWDSLEKDFKLSENLLKKIIT